MSTVRRRERRRREAAREDGPDVWEVVAEFASPDGNNDAAVRQIMRDHSELRELPEQDVRIDILCGRSWSSVRVLRRGAQTEVTPRSSARG
jgi:hypothetical protein